MNTYIIVFLNDISIDSGRLQGCAFHFERLQGCAFHLERLQGCAFHQMKGLWPSLTKMKDNILRCLYGKCRQRGHAYSQKRLSECLGYIWLSYKAMYGMSSISLYFNKAMDMNETTLTYLSTLYRHVLYCVPQVKLLVVYLSQFYIGQRFYSLPRSQAVVFRFG